MAAASKRPRRQAYDVETDAAARAFDKLPGQAFIPERDMKFVPYGKLKPNRAPDWARVAPYVATLVELAMLTNGVTPTHTSLTKAVNKFFKNKNNKTLNEEEMEAGAYALRCMFSQIANHKRATRQVPREYWKTFAVLWDKVIATEPIKQAGDPDINEDDRSESDVEIMIETDRASLFKSEDPMLAAILQQAVFDATPDILL